MTEDWEWMIDVVLPLDGARLFAPAGAPEQWQSVVVMPATALKSDDREHGKDPLAGPLPPRHAAPRTGTGARRHLDTPR